MERSENQSDTQRSIQSNADRGSGEVLSSTSETQGRLLRVQQNTPDFVDMN